MITLLENMFKLTAKNQRKTSKLKRATLNLTFLMIAALIAALIVTLIAIPQMTRWQDPKKLIKTKLKQLKSKL